jgi:dTDP-4-dehydrorhamnose 3,5-epimerase
VKIRESKLNGLKIIEPNLPFEDFRGKYLQTYDRHFLEVNDIEIEFVEEDVVLSYKNVLRGIHGDKKTWKLVTCLFGKVYAAVVNNDPVSEQYKNWDSFELSDENHLQLLIPPMFGNSYLTLSDISLYAYKQSTYYDRRSQFTLAWNDPEVGIRWPIKEPILSKRDEILVSGSSRN